MKTIIEKMASNGLLYLIAENKTQKVYKTIAGFLPMMIKNNKKYFILDNKKYLIDPNKVEFGYKYALCADFHTIYHNYSPEKHSIIWDVNLLSPLKHFKYNTYKDAKNAYRIKFGKEPHDWDIKVRLDCIVVTK